VNKQWVTQKRLKPVCSLSGQKLKLEPENRDVQRPQHKLHRHFYEEQMLTRLTPTVIRENTWHKNWTTKTVSLPRKQDHKPKKNLPQLLLNETSSISQSKQCNRDQPRDNRKKLQAKRLIARDEHFENDRVQVLHNTYIWTCNKITATARNVVVRNWTDNCGQCSKLNGQLRAVQFNKRHWYLRESSMECEQ